MDLPPTIPECDDYDDEADDFDLEDIFQTDRQQQINPSRQHQLKQVCTLAMRRPYSTGKALIRWRTSKPRTLHCCNV
eukprot:m.97432 g.97432  ORF g.97432 m.97432 type:complete len:77 (-) comp26977_c0_seq2:295-525(-)